MDTQNTSSIVKQRFTTSFLLASSLLLATTQLSGCGDAEATDAIVEEEKAVVSIPVEAQNVTNGDISSNYVTTAVLEAKEEAFVVARASGIIDAIYVEEGDYVEKGQVLAKLDAQR
jgi:multidrug efflux pump subunit AcrA (membrane-fusion protein)